MKGLDLIKEIIEQELDELARISTNIKIGDKEKAEATKGLYKGSWIEQMINFVEEAGDTGIPQPELAKKLGKSGQQAINPKVRDFLEANVFTKGELSVPKKEKGPSTGTQGRPTSEKTKVAKELDAKFQEDPEHEPTPEQVELLGAEFIDKLRKRAKGELKRGRPVGTAKPASTEKESEIEDIKDLTDTEDEEEIDGESVMEDKTSINESLKIRMQKIAGIIKD